MPWFKWLQVAFFMTTGHLKPISPYNKRINKAKIQQPFVPPKIKISRPKAT